jgi:exodeoxyribonuclease V alpha subunit
MDGDRIYLQRYHKYETGILESIRNKLKSGEAKLPERLKALESQRDLIRSLGAGYGLEGLEPAEKVDWQSVAAIGSLLGDFSIITGGPGTGKTTTLAKILRILFAIEPGTRLALAAPTGKAAKRMQESLLSGMKSFPKDVQEKIEKLVPTTIHSLLGYKRESVDFKHGRDNPLPYDLVVVDEASMIDLPMFAKLLEATGEGCRLILLGDKDQLASVEAGSLLGDLCQSTDRLNQFTPDRIDWINGFIPDAERRVTGDHAKDGEALLAGCIYELRMSHRFKAQGLIGNLSRAIIAGNVSEVERIVDGDHRPRLTYDPTYEDEVLEGFLSGFESYIRETDVKMALEKLNKLRILVTVREGPRGLHAVTRRIEDALMRKGWIAPRDGFYPHRPVIVTRNNYELGLMNGDIGIVRPDADGRLRVWFEDPEGGIRSVVPAFLSNCETVFAMTIHKSQGSEFDKVLVVLPEGTDNPLLTRELLYTGVTRAREEVVIQGSRETLKKAVASQVMRISGIGHRINAMD